MKNLVDWKNLSINGILLEDEFIKLAHLNNEEAKIIHDRANKVIQFKTITELHISEKTYANRVNELIEKYRITQLNYPNILPKLNVENEYKKSCEYKNVNALITILHNNTPYYCEIKNKYFKTFADIRLFVIEKIEKKYGIKLDELKNYTTYVTGKYNLFRTKKAQKSSPENQK